MAAGVRGLQEGEVEMAGYHCVATLTEPSRGILPDQQCPSVDTTLFFCPSVDAPPSESVRYEAGEPCGNDGDQRLDQWPMEQGAQHPVRQFAPVDLISVADEGLCSIKVDDGRSGMDHGAKSLGEE